MSHPALARGGVAVAPVSTGLAASSVWAVLLAAGEGSRLRAITRDDQGLPVPKQYWPIGNGHTMLGWAIDRAASVVGGNRILPVVARQHERWWRPGLPGLQGSNLIVQPANRGTGAGMLLALVHVLAQDADPVIVFLPTDHDFEDEGALNRTILQAIEAAAAPPGQVVLLGVPPDHPDPHLGYIVPLPEPGGGARVGHFAEKPSAAVAAGLIRRGALWNSFIVVAHARTLLRMFREACPTLVEDFQAAIPPGGDRLDGLYDKRFDCDFSRDILTPLPSPLRVVALPPCGWTDLGTPSRFLAWKEGVATARMA